MRIPPVLLDVVGAMLIVFGILRAVYLGRRRPSRELTEDTPARARARRNNLIFGIVWVLLGLFLIVGVIRHG
jgi:hypothetical protein